MKLVTEPYHVQAARWPETGRNILAQYDDATVVVYQAYRRSIGEFAAAHGYFGGEFSFSRMSWIKPNFLWMMYRCGWGMKPDQETTLAIRLRRDAFEAILQQAVPSSFTPTLFATEDDWRKAVARSSVRLQWDPDHDPSGGKLERRAIQLGLRGEVLERYAKEWIIEIEDISDFVAEQRLAGAEAGWANLICPREEVYEITDKNVVRTLGLAENEANDKKLLA